MKHLLPACTFAAFTLLALASGCASVTETSRPALASTPTARSAARPRSSSVPVAGRPAKSTSAPAGAPVGAYLLETLDAPSAEAATATLDASVLSTQEAMSARLAERKLLAADFRARLERANEILKAQPKDAHALFERAKANSNLKKYKLAKADYVAALRTLHGNPDVYYNKAVNEMMMNEYGLATKDFSGVVRLRPDDKEAFFGRGVAKMQLSQFKAAVADFTRALTLDSLYADALEYRGISYANFDRVREAQQDLEKAARLNPEAQKSLRRYGNGIAQQ